MHFRVGKYSPEWQQWQTYGGAPVFSGEKGDVHTIIQQSHRYVHFVHCYTHQLNLTIEKAAHRTHNPIFFQ